MNFRVAAGVAGLAVAALAGAAQADHLSYYNIPNAQTVNVSAPGGFNGGAYAGRGVLTLNGQNELVFCVDLYHDITLGPQNATYVVQNVTTDSSGAASGTGTPLTAVQIADIKGFIQIGMNTNDPDELAAVQSAIWETISPGTVVTTGDPVLTADLASLLANEAATAKPGPITGYYDATGVMQGFGGVPEPAAWAMMLIGFGLAGGAIRRRPAKAVA
ncbi:MAG: PEP-CTERM sorting domain-containing protein [Caulobacteraceae bacterium]|nr:PEP-CTERM sorting domain-containing protein [Caulobacteraceae bacterium]